MGMVSIGSVECDPIANQRTLTLLFRPEPMINKRLAVYGTKAAARGVHPVSLSIGLANLSRTAVCGALFLAAAGFLDARPATAQAEHHHQEAGPAVAPDYKPSTSGSAIYDRGLKVTRSDGHDLDLASLKGRPTIMTMFFATCPDICPLLTESLLKMESQIPAEELQHLQVVMVSFDERDQPPVLEGFRQAHSITSPRWTVAAASPDVSRALGEALGVRYQKLPNGFFSHTAMIDLIAADGEVMARVPAASISDPKFRAAVRTVIAMHLSPPARSN